MLVVRGRLLKDDGGGLMERTGKVVRADSVLEVGGRLVIFDRPKP